MTCVMIKVLIFILIQNISLHRLAMFSGVMHIHYIPDATKGATMFQAIQVTYYGPTDTKDIRWRVKAQRGAKWFQRNQRVNPSDDALHVAEVFAEELGWLKGFRLVGGTLPNGDYCFVLVKE